MTKKIIIFISGAGSTLHAIIKAFAQNDEIEICLVIANNPKAGGIEIAKKHNIATKVFCQHNYHNRADYCADLHTAISGLSPDLLVLAGFMLVLDGEFVKKWSGKLINIHPSLLPKYKGLHTHERAIAAGDLLHGTSVHFVSTELDSGPIIMQASCSIEGIDDLATIKERVQELERAIYPIAIAGCLRGDYKLDKSVATNFDEENCDHALDWHSKNKQATLTN